MGTGRFVPRTTSFIVLQPHQSEGVEGEKGSSGEPEHAWRKARMTFLPLIPTGTTWPSTYCISQAATVEGRAQTKEGTGQERVARRPNTLPLK